MFSVVITRNTGSMKSIITAIISAHGYAGICSIIGHVTCPANFKRAYYNDPLKLVQ